MASTYDKGEKVEWDWGSGTARGEIESVHTQKTTKTIDGTEVSRDADENCPAYTIKQSDGGVVLKSHSEIRKTS